MMDFLNWIRTSKNGKRESASKNNHGTLFDVQIIHLALAIGDADLARRTAARARTRRIAAQIRFDGAQPYELERAESLEYSQYNLSALFQLATRAEHAGIDLWYYQTARGAGIRKALDFIMPYLEDPKKPWPYRGNRRARDFYPILLQAGRVYNDQHYSNLVKRVKVMSSFSFLDLIR
jgi:hypothetical protein